MHRRSWKRSESRIAGLLHGERIPVNGRAGPDIAHPWLSPEVKSRKDLPAYLWDWLRQAQQGAPEDKLPVVVMHKAGRPHSDDLLLLRLGDFLDWFGS